MNSSTLDEMCDTETPEKLAALALIELKSIDIEPCNVENISNVIDNNLNLDKKFTLLSILKNDENLNSFTGINFKLLERLCVAVRSCEKKVNRFSISLEDRIVLCFCVN